MRISLMETLEAFLISLEAQGRSPRTILSYQERLSSFIKLYQTKPLADITPTDVDLWMVEQRRKKSRWANHPGKPTTNGRLSDATLSSRLQALKTFMKWCAERDYIQKSPARHLKRIRYSHANKVMESDDLAALLRAAKDERERAILLFFASTGARVGEVATLTISNLDLVNCEASIDGKTGEGDVCFNNKTRKAIEDWLEVRPECDHDFLFTGTYGNHTGRPLLPNGINQLIRRIGKRAGINGPCNPHSIRHLVGQTFTDEGNLALAQEKLRHKDVTTTAEFYAHQDKKRVKDATDRLSNLVTGLEDDEVDELLGD